MQFRVRPASIQLIRSVPNAEKGRSVNEVVGLIPRRTLALSDEVKSKLTRTEARAVEKYLVNFRNTRQLADKLAAHRLAETVADAAEYFASVTDDDEREILKANFIAAATELRRISR